jgi:hypothetical protein
MDVNIDTSRLLSGSPYYTMREGLQQRQPKMDSCEKHPDRTATIADLRVLSQTLHVSMDEVRTNAAAATTELAKLVSAARKKAAEAVEDEGRVDVIAARSSEHNNFMQLFFDAIFDASEAELVAVDGRRR